MKAKKTKKQTMTKKKPGLIFFTGGLVLAAAVAAFAFSQFMGGGKSANVHVITGDAFRQYLSVIKREASKSDDFLPEGAVDEFFSALEGSAAGADGIEVSWKSGNIDLLRMNGDIRDFAIPSLNVKAKRVALETAREKNLLLAKKFVLKDFSVAEDKNQVKVEDIQAENIIIYVPEGANTNDVVRAVIDNAYKTNLQIKGVDFEVDEVRTSLDTLSIEGSPPVEKGRVGSYNVRLKSYIIETIPSDFDEPFLQHLFRNGQAVVNFDLRIDGSGKPIDGFPVVDLNLEIELENLGSLDFLVTLATDTDFDEMIGAVLAEDTDYLMGHLFLVDARLALRDKGFLDEFFAYLDTPEGGGLSRDGFVRQTAKNVASVRQFAPHSVAALENALRDFLLNGGGVEISLKPDGMKNFAVLFAEVIAQVFVGQVDLTFKAIGFAVKNL